MGPSDLEATIGSMLREKTSTEVLQDAFPGRVSLSPQEIAAALFGADKATKKRVESIRVALDEGQLVPGIRKTGARWSVPIAALGAALDEQRRRETAVARDISTTPRRSAHSTLGPRMLLRVKRSRFVLQQVLDELTHLHAVHLGDGLGKGWANAPVKDSEDIERF